MTTEAIAFISPFPTVSGSRAGFTQRLCRRQCHSPTMSSGSPSTRGTVTVLDYGAGNVRSLQNAISSLGFDIKWVRDASDIENAEKLVFPGVGAFGVAMENLSKQNFVEPLKKYIEADRPFLGICLGLHTLFEGSDESPGVNGLGVFPGRIRRFQFDPTATQLAIPHIGWNVVRPRRPSILLGTENPCAAEDALDRYYFVHSYRLGLEVEDNLGDAVLATTLHGEEYVSVLQRSRICATQFHPEKSGRAGLRLLNNFLTASNISATKTEPQVFAIASKSTLPRSELAKRVVACLDVRENDEGDLVVTKGDQYDVREKSDARNVRNLGKPVELARRYYNEGADEICFLNITSFRGEPVGSAPMIEVLERTSEGVFVPLCIGGGIRDYTDRNGVQYSALDVASMYFRAGADKISLGSDAVFAAEKYLLNGKVKDGSSSIEKISIVYGAQAVVISLDPKRVYVERAEDTPHTTVKLPDGRVCWYQCTVKGGREGRDIDVVQVATAAEELGAGEILINCMDEDGQKNGYDHTLINLVRQHVGIPVIASSGAGSAVHFTECFDETEAEAALAAGIFHRMEVSIDEVKTHMYNHGTPVRRESESATVAA